jgi:hypothetical protein
MPPEQQYKRNQLGFRFRALQRRLRELEAENARLTRQLAEVQLHGRKDRETGSHST